MYVTVETILTASAVLGALGGFVTLAWKLFKWINHQKEQDALIALLDASTKRSLSRWRQGTKKKWLI